MSLLEKARAALKKGAGSEALAFALEGMKRECSPSEAVEFNRLAAEALLAGGQLGRARTYAEIARKDAISAGDERLAYNCAVTLGKVFARANQYAAAEQSWSEALTLAGVKKDPRRQGLVLLDMAMLDQRRGNHRRALNTFKTVSRTFEETNSLRPLAVCYGRMVFSFLEEGKINDAISSSERLEKLAQTLDDRNLLAISLFRKGSIYLKQDEFSKALTLFKESAKLFKELGDIKNRVLVLCDIARAYMNLGYMKKADSTLNQATKIAEKVESGSLYCKVRVTLAEEAVLDDAWEKAREYYRHALLKAEETDNESSFHILHESLTQATEELGLDLEGLEDLLVRAKEGYLRLGLTREAKETEEWLNKIP